MMMVWLICFTTQFANAQAQVTGPPVKLPGTAESTFVRPFPGSLVLCGDGAIPDCVFKSFAQLAEVNDPDSDNNVVVFCDNDDQQAFRVLKELCGERVELVDCSSAESLRQISGSMRDRIMSCSGVWLDLASPPSSEKLAGLMIRELFNRRKVVGAAGDWASQMLSITASDDNESCGLKLIPDCRMHRVGKAEEKMPETSSLEKGLIHWLVPDESALVFVRGRIASSHGNHLVRMVTLPLEGDPVQEVLNLTEFQYGDLIEGSDLVVQFRRIRFLQKQPQKFTSDFVGLENGTLILHGGGGVSDDIFNLFIEAAGGKEARFVCIPTAGDDDDSSYSARRLVELGCKHVEILHTRDPVVADSDERLLKMLDEANAVWMDGGRTYRVMESYENTQVQKKFHDLLRRGGVFGGSSAGCQVASELLVRGNPSSADQLEFHLYNRGLGLLTGVILDAHFRQRYREFEFGYLVLLHPELLGIGVDENTAIVVKGEIATIVGTNGVTFFDANHPVSTGPATSIPKQTFLKSGSQYNLKTRQPVSDGN